MVYKQFIKEGKKRRSKLTCKRRMKVRKEERRTKTYNYTNKYKVGFNTIN